MLSDVLNVLDIEGQLSGKEKRVGGFDLMWNDGPVSTDDFLLNEQQACGNLVSNTFLGCCNTDRSNHLKHMYKTATQLKNLNS